MKGSAGQPGERWGPRGRVASNRMGWCRLARRVWGRQVSNEVRVEKYPLSGGGEAPSPQPARDKEEQEVLGWLQGCV